MKKLYVGLGLILVLVASMFVWSKQTNKINNTSTPTLKIGLNPWIGNGIYYVAKEKGFFAKENLNVEFIDYDDGAVAKQLLANGQMDVLDLTPETAVVLVDSGVKIKVIAMTDTSEGADGIIVTEEIKTLADLKGKKVAFENGSPSHLLLSYLLDKEGLTTKDLESVNMPAPDTGSAFLSGSVDAAVTWEPWLSKAVERPGGKILASSKTSPILPNLLMVKEEQVKNNSLALKKMLRALFNAEEFIAAHKDEAYPDMAQGLKISVQDVQDQIPTFHWFNYQDNLNTLTQGEFSATTTIQNAADLWLRLGLIKNQVRAQDIVDDSLIKNLYK